MSNSTVIDLLTYVLPDQEWALENHLAVAGDNGQPIYTFLRGNMIWDIKSAAGYPWDGNIFDEHYIYQSITEQSWTDSSSFKMFASSSWPGANGGVVWMPRYMTPGMFSPPVVTGDSTYRTYPGGDKPFTVQSLGGPIETHVEGPFEGQYAIDFGGDIGVAASTIRQVYKWGVGSAGYANIEVNYFVRGFGRVRWQLWTLANGVYQLKQDSLFNTIVAGGVPALNFPSTIPTIE